MAAYEVEARTTPETEADLLYAPNDPCLTAWQDDLPTAFHDRVYAALIRNRVPWVIIKQLADERWTDVTGLAKRWGTEEQLYQKAPESLRITNLPVHQQEKIIACIAGAREDLKQLKDHQASLSTKAKAAQVVDTLDRKAMEDAFQKATQARLELKYEGSNNLLGKLHKAMAEGRIENLQFKDLTTFHPAPSARQNTQQVRNADGSFSEVDVVTRRMPTTLEEWMDACKVFYHSLMMVSTQHNEHPRLKPHWETLRDFYEKFLFGSRVAKRRVPPTVAKLVYLERQAWNQIIEMLWEHTTMTITEAIEDLQGDSLWWTNELSNTASTSLNSPTYTTGRAPKGGGKSKGGKWGGRGKGGRYQAPGRGVYQQSFGKGKGKKGKGKGKGKRNDLQQRNNSQQGSWPRPPQSQNGGNWNNNNNNRPQNNGGQMHPKIPRQQWIQRPNGIAFCENYHIYGTCRDGRNCTREHICPGCGQGVHPLHACANC